MDGRAFFERILWDTLGRDISLQRTFFASGGCINNTLTLLTSEGKYFLKWHNNIPADMYKKEAMGLARLARGSAIKIPEVLGYGTIEGKDYLLMEHIESAPMQKNYWEDLGRSLAEMHRSNSTESFGLDHDNYIGRLPQKNTFHGNWIVFFTQNRLEYQLQMALKNGLVGNRFADNYRAFYDVLPDLLPNEAPALLHGDLWSGTVMTGPDGRACLIDPAVYFGHREIELAFTLMFGGFDRTFYNAYQEAYPLMPGFDERVDIYNIYPHMVHVNLFGTSYLSGVERVLRRYV